MNCSELEYFVGFVGCGEGIESLQSLEEKQQQTLATLRMVFYR